MGYEYEMVDVTVGKCARAFMQEWFPEWVEDEG